MLFGGATAYVPVHRRFSLQVSPPHAVPPQPPGCTWGLLPSPKRGRARLQAPMGRREGTATPALGSALPLPPPAPGGTGHPPRRRGGSGRGPGRGRVPAGGAGSLPPRRRLGGAWAALPAAAGGRAMAGKRLCLGVLSLGVLLLAAASGGAEPPPSCEGVRKVFQLRQLGPLRGVPESPRAGKGQLGGGQKAQGAAGAGGRPARARGGGFEFGAAGGGEWVGPAAGPAGLAGARCLQPRRRRAPRLPPARLPPAGRAP